MLRKKRAAEFDSAREFSPVETSELTGQSDVEGVSQPELDSAVFRLVGRPSVKQTVELPSDLMIPGI